MRPMSSYLDAKNWPGIPYSDSKVHGANMGSIWGRQDPAGSHVGPINTLRPKQNGRNFADDILKCIFLNENVWIPNKISLKFVPKGPINNNPALVQVMAWRRPGDKPLSEPMVVRLPTHICVTRPQWVNFAIWNTIVLHFACQFSSKTTVPCIHINAATLVLSITAPEFIFNCHLFHIVSAVVPDVWPPPWIHWLYVTLRWLM